MRKTLALLALLAPTLSLANTENGICYNKRQGSSGEISITVPDIWRDAAEKIRPEIHYRMQLSWTNPKPRNVPVFFEQCVNNRCTTDVDGRWVFLLKDSIEVVNWPYSSQKNTVLPVGSYPISYRISIPDFQCDVKATATVHVR